MTCLGSSTAAFDDGSGPVEGEEDGILDCSRPDRNPSPPPPLVALDPCFITLAILIDLPNVFFFLFVTDLPNDVLDLGVGPAPKS